MREEGEFGAVGHDVEDVGVVVHAVEAVRVFVEEGGEDGFGFVEVFGVVEEEGALGFEERGSGEEGFEFVELAVDVVRELVELLVGVEDEKEGHEDSWEGGHDGVKLNRD